MLDRIQQKCYTLDTVKKGDLPMTMAIIILVVFFGVCLLRAIDSDYLAMMFSATADLFLLVAILANL